MNANSNPNYFRLGAFVLTGIAVLIAVILIFGGGKFFQNSFIIETYIKQSVTGLDTGADVRFRGVKLGQVSSIGLSGDMYEKNIPLNERRQYVVVRMKIFANQVSQEQINEFVANNLRARVKSMGITGVNYVEFDFISPANLVPQLPYSWKPEYPVIPSMPNQADEIISGIQKLVSSLDNMNLVGTTQKFDTLLNNLNVIMAGDGKGNEGLVLTVQNMNVILGRIAKVTNNDELNVLVRELIGSMVALRQTITSMQGDTQYTIENLKQTSEQLNELTRIASQSPSSLIWGEPPAKIVLPSNGTQAQTGAAK
jgi:ABC-type transporter Mla subunit MlaD